MVENVIKALLETVGSHPELHGSLEQALKRRNIDLNAPYFHITCRNVGTAYTTPTFLLENKSAGTWTARAGIAIMGQTNMPDEELARLSPFDEKFYDNYAEGIGKTPAEAIDRMASDRRSIADSLWAEPEPKKGEQRATSTGND